MGEMNLCGTRIYSESLCLHLNHKYLTLLLVEFNETDHRERVIERVKRHVFQHL